ALQHWNVVHLDGVPIPHFIDILYGYLLVNITMAAPFIYLERRAQVAAEALCPACKQPLQMCATYTCSDCGKIEFKKVNP
ncbi:hypothetical protein M1N87_02710, partial [Dehalococcoidia bacterium]|nr:hypothetical protein [Dehalococcoidia bacterium]